MSDSALSNQKPDSKTQVEHGPVRRVMVGTDRSRTADEAVQWAASFADRFSAELFVVQVIVPRDPASTAFGVAECTRADAARVELVEYAHRLAKQRGHGLVVVDPDPASAIVRAAEQEAIDVLVIGNLGMAGRKEFLLGNVPNRISHNARCTVIIVNTSITGDLALNAAPLAKSHGPSAAAEPHLAGRGARNRIHHGEARSKGAVWPSRRGRRGWPAPGGKAPARRPRGAGPHFLEAWPNFVDAPGPFTSGVY